MTEENKKYYVYLLVDPFTNKPFYVGKGFGRRAEWHTKTIKQNKRTENYYKDNKIRKILFSGKEPKIDIIFSNLTEDLAYAIETKVIQFFGRIKYDHDGILTNVCIDNKPPSSKGKKHKEETKRKIGKANSDGRTANYGLKNGFYGKKHSDETLDKIREKNRITSKERFADPEYVRRWKLARSKYVMPESEKEIRRQRRIEYNKNLPEHHRLAVKRSNMEQSLRAATKLIKEDYEFYRNVILELSAGVEFKQIYKKYPIKDKKVVWRIKRKLSSYVRALNELEKKVTNDKCC